MKSCADIGMPHEPVKLSTLVAQNNTQLATSTVPFTTSSLPSLPIPSAESSPRLSSDTNAGAHTSMDIIIGASIGCGAAVIMGCVFWLLQHRTRKPQLEPSPYSLGPPSPTVALNARIRNWLAGQRSVIPEEAQSPLLAQEVRDTGAVAMQSFPGNVHLGIGRTDLPSTMSNSPSRRSTVLDKSHLASDSRGSLGWLGLSRAGSSVSARNREPILTSEDISRIASRVVSLLKPGETKNR